MTYDEYTCILDRFKAALGHGTVTCHLYKLADGYVKLTRWRKYYFNSMTPRQIKHVGKIVTRRVRARHTQNERRNRRLREGNQARGTAVQEVLDALSM